MNDIDNPKLKQCQRCGELKPEETQFLKHGIICKKCFREQYKDIRTEKTCSKCGKTYPINLFKKWSSICPECLKIKNKEYNIKYNNTPEKRKERCEKEKLRYKNNKDKFREIARCRNYNITVEFYRDLIKKQDNKCAICGLPESALDRNGNLKSLAIDHCHTTNKIRGLLCGNCNTAIGLLKENPNNLLSAIKYLSKTNT